MLEEAAREWEKRFVREGREEGLQQGEMKGMKRALLQVLEQRFGPLPEPVRGQVEKIDAKSEVERLLQRALKADSLADLRIGRPSRKRNPSS